MVWVRELKHSILSYIKPELTISSLFFFSNKKNQKHLMFVLSCEVNKLVKNKRMLE